jgi:hypothetical protein
MIASCVVKAPYAGWPLAALAIRGETMLRYAVNGSAEMTDIAR